MCTPQLGLGAQFGASCTDSLSLDNVGMRRPTSVAAPVIGRRMDSQARQDALGHMARMGTQPGRPVAHALGRPPVVEHGVSRTCLLRTPNRMILEAGALCHSRRSEPGG